MHRTPRGAARRGPFMNDENGIFLRGPEGKHVLYKADCGDSWGGGRARRPSNGTTPRDVARQGVHSRRPPRQPTLLVPLHECPRGCESLRKPAKAQAGTGSGCTGVAPRLSPRAAPRPIELAVRRRGCSLGCIALPATSPERLRDERTRAASREGDAAPRIRLEERRERFALAGGGGGLT